MRYSLVRTETVTETRTNPHQGFGVRTETVTTTVLVVVGVASSEEEVSAMIDQIGYDAPVVVIDLKTGQAAELG